MDEKERFRVKIPSQKDVLSLNARHDKYRDTDEMVDLCDWDGGCWQTLFDGIIKEYADAYGMRQWDVFAALLHNFLFGMEDEP